MKKLLNSEFKEFNKVILKYFIILFIIFIASVVVFKLVLVMNPENVTNKLDNAPQNAYSTKDGYRAFFGIFFNNTIACLIAIISGFIPFVFLPVISVIRNTYYIGLLLAGFEIIKINTFLAAMVTLVPHGIFEIPAVIYAFSIGTYLCISTTTSIIKGASSKKYISEIKKAFIYIIMPLLFVASLIEVYIVPYLGHIFII